ncbi:MAG: sulfite exporter TauE/SafE family protein, partial [Aeromonas sp.]
MNPVNLDLFGALLMGLAGSSHCFAMCGGVSAALSMAIAPHQQRLGQRFAYLLCYNLGRIVSYMLAGALVGGVLASMV